MRDGFKSITSGWTLVDDPGHLDDRIEEAARWTKFNSPLQEDEAATVKLMIETRVAMGIREGDFEPFIPANTNPRDIFK